MQVAITRLRRYAAEVSAEVDYLRARGIRVTGESRANDILLETVLEIKHAVLAGGRICASL